MLEKILTLKEADLALGSNELAAPEKRKETDLDVMANWQCSKLNSK